jgi:pyroglutamyl peptidase
MKILYTAFNGKSNSSKILLDNIIVEEDNKLYLKNSFKTSAEQLSNKLKKDRYDLIISFGQAPIDKETIKIETRGNGIDYFETDYDYNNLKKLFEKNGFNVVISKDAGNYLCNNIYYNGLKYIRENNLKCKMIFVHIPQIDNINDIKKISAIF